MSYRKSLIALIASAALLLGACNDEKAESPKTSEEKPEIQGATTQATGEQVIVDHLDREVTLPSEIKTIVSGTLLPYYSTWYVATNSTKEIIGMHPVSMSTAKNSVLADMSPEVLKASTSFIENGEVNIEELMKLNPDVLFAPSGSEELIDKTTSAGIKTIGLNTINANSANPLSTFDSWLTVTSKMTNTTDRADRFLGEARSVQSMLNEKLGSLSDEEKPRVMFLFQHSDKMILISGKNHFGNQWLQSTGGIDVAEDDIIGSKQVNMEQIYEWNPDIIYITNFTDTQPEDLINNSIPNQDWSQIKAVQDGNVHRVPVGIFRWYPPSGDAPLMLKWLAQKNHPTLFDYNIEKEIKSYYADFYGYDLSDEQVYNILHPVSDNK